MAQVGGAQFTVALMPVSFACAGKRTDGDVTVDRTDSRHWRCHIQVEPMSFRTHYCLDTIFSLFCVLYNYLLNLKICMLI
jgi:hypothetical protein